MSSYFQEILAWRFAGAACWGLAISLLAEFAVGIAFYLLSIPRAFDMLGVKGLVLLGLQFAVQV